MPSADQILVGLTGITNDWRALAALWHGYFAALLVGLVAGLRPSRRVMGVLLTLPLLSVSTLAWLAGNPFNGSSFALASAALIALSVPLRGHARIASTPLVSCGTAMLVFGWVYPHFLVAESYVEYLYAAPTGLIPCPTLAIVIGLALIVGGLDSRAWSIVLGITGLFYGVFGGLILGVHIDWILTIAALAMLVVGFRPSAIGRSAAHE